MIIFVYVLLVCTGGSLMQPDLQQRKGQPTVLTFVKSLKYLTNW